MDHNSRMPDAGPGPSTSHGHGHPSPERDSSGGRWKESDSKRSSGPVKAACLSCRQKKAKCDGAKPVCGQCSRKQIECIYIKSKRGGARKKRVANPPTPLVEYLKKLDQFLNVPKFGLRHAEVQEGDDPTNIVRTFETREEILRCYYTEVHPYLPVMPPRHLLVDILPTLLPNSPFLLAVQTIMTLVPHPLDPNPQSPQSKRMRSAASAELGRQTTIAIEQTQATTQSLEVVQALTILGVWEWGSTNDAQTAISKYASAMQVAMDMGIHNMDLHGSGTALEGIDWRMDTRRRTWWLLYVYQLTAALVSGNKAHVGADDDRIHVDFPVCSDKDRTWATWANCIRQCYRVINLVNEIVFANGGPAGGMGAGWGGPISGANAQQTNRSPAQMLEVDKQIMLLMKETERMSVIEAVPGGEEDVATNQQIATRLSLAVAHIHIHRWTAFPEVSLFSKRICGFTQNTVTSDEDSQDEFNNQSFPGSTFSHGSHSGSAMSHAGSGLSRTPSPMLQPPLPQSGMASPQRVPSPHLSPYGTPAPLHSPHLSPYVAPAPLPQTPAQYGLPQMTPTPSPNAYGNPLANQYNASLDVPQPLYSGQQNLAGGSVFRNQEVSQVDQMMASLSTLSTALPPMGGNMASAGPSSGQQFHQQRQQFNASPLSNHTPLPAGLPMNSYSAQQQISPAVQYNPEMGSYTPSLLEPGTLPQRRSSLNAPADMSMPPFNSGFQPALNLSIPNDPSQPAPAFNPALQEQWHYDLQQPQSAEPPYSSISDDMWQPETFPDYLPQPWFSRPHGAGDLTHFGPEDNDIKHYPVVEVPTISHAPSASGSVASTSTKKHKAWGVDESGAIERNAVVEAAELADAFPPGISLARCATAAHTIVRLEVLHRSAALAMDGPPRWIPFCSCGLVSGAYAFLLLILAVQAENTFGERSQERIEEVENLLTNVRVILAGLEAYGIMWEGIDMMAREVRAAVEAATSLPLEIRSQMSGTPSEHHQ